MTPDRYMQIRDLANRLIMSCDGGRDESDELDALDIDECGVLDGMAFCCTCCDQWYPIQDKQENELDEWVCEDCSMESEH